MQDKSKEKIQVSLIYGDEVKLPNDEHIVCKNMGMPTTKTLEYQLINIQVYFTHCICSQRLLQLAKRDLGEPSIILYILNDDEYRELEEKLTESDKEKLSRLDLTGETINLDQLKDKIYKIAAEKKIVPKPDKLDPQWISHIAKSVRIAMGYEESKPSPAPQDQTPAGEEVVDEETSPSQGTGLFSFSSLKQLLTPGLHKENQEEADEGACCELTKLS